jgi:hypothetical protein
METKEGNQKILKIDLQEWKFIGFVGVLFIFLNFLPIIIGKITTPENSIFFGVQGINSYDRWIYYNLIEQVKDGHYLFKNFFTSEPHSYFIFDPFWLIIGFLAKIFSLSSPLAFHLSRFLLIPVFLITAYYLIAFFFEKKIKRKICFIFLVFASGLGWLWGSFSLGVSTPIDLWVPEAFSFW